MAKKKMDLKLRGRKTLASKGQSGEKKDHNSGLTLETEKWIEDFAVSRGVHKTVIRREMADMYIASVESQKGDFNLNDLMKNMNIDVVTQTKTK